MDFFTLQHVQHDDFLNVMKEKLATKLENRTQIYGKKGEKVKLLSQLAASKHVILEFMTHHQEFAADTNALPTINNTSHSFNK